MVLEATMICVDNSEWMRNGDYTPTRFKAQADAVKLICVAKTKSNPDNTVGVVAMAGKGLRVLVTPTRDSGKIFDCMDGLEIGGAVNLERGIQVAHWALKHRINKKQKQRIIVFAGSPFNHDKSLLKMIGLELKENSVALDIVDFGESADEKPENLEAIVSAANNEDNSHIVHIPPGQDALSDVLTRTPIFTGGDGKGRGGFFAAAVGNLNPGQDDAIASPKQELASLQQALGALSMDDATASIDPDVILVDIIEGLQVIYQCPQCEQYLDPPGSGTWVIAGFRSKELLTLCIKRLNLNNQVTLVDAEFLRTGPQSKQIKVKLIVKINGAVLEQIVEYDLHEQRCLRCTKYPFDEWNTKVKLREHDDSRRSVCYVEWLMAKDHGNSGAIEIRGMNRGLDYYFDKHSTASKFVSLIEEVAPVRHGFVSKLVHGDAKRNPFNQFTFYVEISPICCWDLICLPPKLANSKNLGPLVICTKVTNNIDLLDPLTLRSCFLDGEQYFQWEFKPLLTHRQLVLYIVKCVEEISSSDQSVSTTTSSYTLADVQIARVRGNKKDLNFKVRTHLGHMEVGDYALGYDLDEANLNSEELDKHRGLTLPEAILVKKYGEERPPKTLEMEELEKKQHEKEREEYLRDLKEMYLRDLKEMSTVDEEEKKQIIGEEEKKRMLKENAEFLRYLRSRFNKSNVDEEEKKQKRSPPDCSPK